MGGQNLIAFLEGIVEVLGTNYLVLKVGDIGYQVNIPTYNKLPARVGDRIKLYTYLYVREDRIILYGFFSKEEESLFELVIGTPGIGPKVGLSILSKMSPDFFKKAIIQEDLNSITLIAGIGNKLAKKLVLELKEKIGKESALEGISWLSPQPEIINDAIDALKSLGYNYKKAKLAVEKTREKIKQELTLEELIKESLKVIK